MFDSIESDLGPEVTFRLGEACNMTDDGYCIASSLSPGTVDPFHFLPTPTPENPNLGWAELLPKWGEKREPLPALWRITPCGLALWSMVLGTPLGCLFRLTFRMSQWEHMWENPHRRHTHRAALTMELSGKGVKTVVGTAAGATPPRGQFSQS